MKWYIFSDEDVTFVNIDTNKGFEKLLEKYMPEIANPNLRGYFGPTTQYFFPNYYSV